MQGRFITHYSPEDPSSPSTFWVVVRARSRFYLFRTAAIIKLIIIAVRNNVSWAGETSSPTDRFWACSSGLNSLPLGSRGLASNCPNRFGLYTTKPWFYYPIQHRTLVTAFFATEASPTESKVLSKYPEWWLVFTSTGRCEMAAQIVGHGYRYGSSKTAYVISRKVEALKTGIAIIPAELETSSTTNLSMSMLNMCSSRSNVKVRWKCARPK